MSLNDKLIARGKIVCGKYDFCGKGRTVNLIDIDIEVRRKADGNYTASFMGGVWNTNHTDIITGGQCQDALREFHEDFREGGKYAVVMDLWDRCHLNDMHAGTPEQEACVREHLDKYDYKKACEVLKEHGLYVVQVNGKPYEYGHGWLTWPIAKKDLDAILILCEQRFDLAV